MSILQKYTLRELLGPFLLGLLVFTFVFLIGMLFKLTELLLNTGVSPWLAGELILSLLPRVFSMTIPMAVLVAILLGVGRLAADREILAIRMSGVNLMHICFPILVVAGIITGVMLYANQRFVPYLNLKTNDLQTQILFELVSAIAPDRAKDVEADKGKPGLTIYYDERDPKSGDWQRVSIRSQIQAAETKEDIAAKDDLLRRYNDLKRNKDKKSKTEVAKIKTDMDELKRNRKYNDALIVAESGKISANISERLVMINLTTGSMHIIDPHNEAGYTVVRFDSMTKGLRPSLTKTEESGAFKKRPAEMTTAELRAKIAAPGITDRYVSELCQRHSVPLACIAFALIAMPLAIYVRPTGKAIAFAIAFFVILLYYGLLEYGTSLVKSGGGGIGPFAIFFPNILLSLIGSVLLYRMVMK